MTEFSLGFFDAMRFLNIFCQQSDLPIFVSFVSSPGRSFVELARNIIEIIGNTADNLINEIKMSIEHYIQENSRAKIEKIILTGENLINFEN